MKKVLKLSLIIISILMLLLSNFCYATSNVAEQTTEDVNSVEMPEEGIPAEWARNLDPNASSEDMVMDGALENLYSEDGENSIMLINDEIEIPSNMTDSDIYLFQESISIEEDVNGNIYVIGKKIDISSNYINGNIFAIGEDITINGLISGSIYALGENINIGAGSVNVVYAIGKNVRLGENANIMNDFKVGADNLNIAGNVNRSLDAYVEKLNIEETAEYVAKGNISYSEEVIDPNEVLEAVALTKHEKNEKTSEELQKIAAIGKVKSEIITIISTAIIIAVIYFIVKNKQTDNSENYSKEIVSNIVKGILYLIFVPLVALVLICTIIGIPLSLLGIVIYVIALCLSIPVASLKIAEMLYRVKPIGTNKAIIILYAICVYIVIEVVSLLPAIGGLIRFLVFLYGLGSFMKYFSPSKSEKVKVEEVEVIREEN